MLNFKAYFYGNDVYINEKFKYDSNEILISYLNDKRAKYILKSDFVGKLKDFKLCLTLSPYMDHYIFSRYDDNVRAAMNVLDELNSIIFSLPPFDKILNYSVMVTSKNRAKMDLGEENRLKSAEHTQYGRLFSLFFLKMA